MSLTVPVRVSYGFYQSYCNVSRRILAACLYIPLKTPPTKPQSNCFGADITRNFLSPKL